MENFTWQCPTKIIFGKETIHLTGKEITAFGGTNVLIVYGGGSIKKNGIYSQVIQSLTESDLSYTELPGVAPNPHLSLVLEGIKVVKEKKIDFILAVGGGSVIDTAKAISFGSAIPAGKDIWTDYFMVQGVSIPKGITLGTILTIPAAGSEMSNSCVITNTETQYKRGVNSPYNYPAFSIADPQVCYSLPAYQTACGCADMLSHMQERYFTNVQSSLTDNMLEGAMRTVIEYAPLACADGKNYDYRAELMFASTVAHNNFIGCGRVGDWASHWLEHELSGQYDIAHGAGLAIITPAWMKYVYKYNINRFMQFAIRVMGVDLPLTDPEAVVLAGIARLEAWYRSIGLPVTLKEASIDAAKDINIMAKRVLEGGRTAAGNLRKLLNDDIVNIYKLAL